MHAVIFLWIIFYDFIEANVPFVNYWDELAMFLVLCWGVWPVRKKQGLQKQEQIDWICVGLLLIIGVLGNMVHPGLQEAKVALVKDAVALAKFPVIFLVLSRRSMKPVEQEAVVASIAGISRIFIIVTLLAVVAGRFADVGFYTDEIRVVPAFEFIFSHPTFYISSCVMVAAALIAGGSFLLRRVKKGKCNCRKNSETKEADQ